MCVWVYTRPVARHGCANNPPTIAEVPGLSHSALARRITIGPSPFLPPPLPTPLPSPSTSPSPSLTPSLPACPAPLSRGRSRSRWLGSSAASHGEGGEGAAAPGSTVWEDEWRVGDKHQRGGMAVCVRVRVCVSVADCVSICVCVRARHVHTHKHTILPLSAFTCPSYANRGRGRGNTVYRLMYTYFSLVYGGR